MKPEPCNLIRPVIFLWKTTSLRKDKTYFFNLYEVCEACEDDATDKDEEDKEKKFFVAVLKIFFSKKELSIVCQIFFKLTNCQHLSD